jgi:F0F1-type ATP synthase assembly protein I
MAQASDEFDSTVAFSQEPNPEDIRDQMAETRASLAEKLDSLQNRVEHSVESAQSSVEHTVNLVKDTVDETLDSVKRTFDLPYQVERHPWTMMGLSVLAGYTLGCLAPRKCTSFAKAEENGAAWADRSPMHLAAQPHTPRPVPADGSTPPVSVLDRFGDEVDKLKGIAIGAALGWIRDHLMESLPTVSDQLADVVDSATRKLGAEPLASHHSLSKFGTNYDA